VTQVTDHNAMSAHIIHALRDIP